MARQDTYTNGSVSDAIRLLGLDPADTTQSPQGSTRNYLMSSIATHIIAQIVASAPGTLDTLNELAAALGDDPNFAATMTAALAGKAAVSHTHVASAVTDFAEAVDDRVAALLVAGTNVSLIYNDAAGTMTINAVGGGGGGVTVGTAPPATAPASTGLLFLDDTANVLYVSTGTASSADWLALVGDVSTPITTKAVPVLADQVFGFDDATGFGAIVSTWAEVIAALKLSRTDAAETLTNKALIDPKITLGINSQTGTTYTLVLADAHRKVLMNNAAANTLTVPTNATVAYPVGTVISVAQIGAGTTSITAAAGVTLDGVTGSTTISAQWKGATLTKISTNGWMIEGAIGPVA